MGRGVFYYGTDPLPIGTVVALYRCLLVRSTRFTSWLARGMVDASVDSSYWRNYTVSLRFDDSEGTEWLCLPVGDDEANIANGEASWFSLGKLSKQAVKQALAALNRKILVDWTVQYNAAAAGEHLRHVGNLRNFGPYFNEPSGEAQGQGDAALPNVDVRAHGALHCGPKSSYCGIMLATATTRPIHQGDELVWCYGQAFERHYTVSTACKERPAMGPATRHQHAAYLLSRGGTVGRTERWEFHENCVALGLADGSRGTHIDRLFEVWDEDVSGTLERHEIEAGVVNLIEEMELK